MIRQISGILCGYAIFAVSALLLFKVSGQDPHADPTAFFAILTSLYGAAFSFIGGLVLQPVANTGSLKLNYILAFIMAGFAAFSLLKTSGNHYTQLLAIFIFAPISILGGQMYLTRNKK